MNVFTLIVIPVTTTLVDFHCLIQFTNNCRIVFPHSYLHVTDAGMHVWLFADVINKNYCYQNE